MYKKIIMIFVIFLFIAPVSASQIFSLQIGEEEILLSPKAPLYIMPQNEVVQKYADKLYLDDFGKLRYQQNGTKINHTYIPDIEQFGMDEYWLLPDRFILNDFKGDCEDSAIMVTSILRSGNVSVLRNGVFEKQRIDAVFVAGSSGEKYHAWVEYEYGNIDWVYSHSSKTGTTSFQNDGSFEKKLIVTEIIALLYQKPFIVLG